jgi:hypothetical protein
MRRARVRATAAQGSVARASDVVRLFEDIDAELGRPAALVDDAAAVGPVVASRLWTGPRSGRCSS